MILEIMGLGQKPQTKNQDEGLEGIGFCSVPRNYCYYFIFIILTWHFLFFKAQDRYHQKVEIQIV